MRTKECRAEAQWPGREATCCFTGHRAAKLPWGSCESDARCLALKRCIYDAAEAIYHSGVRHYICGMANGCDLYFGEAVVKLRAEHPEVTLEAAIPCPEQSARWPEAERRRYQKLLDECDAYTLISQRYVRDCMMRRNRYMVDASGWLIAAYNGSPGGTRATLRYAMRRKLRILQLPMQDREISVQNRFAGF